MSLIGKIFVMVNLVISLLMAAGAFVLFVTNPDYTDNAAKAGQPAGKLKQVQQEIENAKATRSIAEENLKLAYAPLLKIEDKRRTEQAWFDKQMKEIKTLPELQVVETPKIDVDLMTGKIIDVGLPKMVDAHEVQADPATPKLLNAAEYRKNADSWRAQSKTLLEDITKLAADDNKLTRELAGGPMGVPRGLRQKIGLEREKRQGLLEEQGVEEGMKVNADVESELILLRKEQLEQRLLELKSYLKRRHKVDVDTKDG